MPSHQDGHVDFLGLLKLLNSGRHEHVFGNLPANFVLAIDENITISVYSKANEFHCSNGRTLSTPNDFLKRKCIKIEPGCLSLFAGDCFHGGAKTTHDNDRANHLYWRYHGYLVTEVHNLDSSESLEQGWLHNYVAHVEAGGCYDRDEKQSN